MFLYIQKRKLKFWKIVRVTCEFWLYFTGALYEGEFASDGRSFMWLNTSF